MLYDSKDMQRFCAIWKIDYCKDNKRLLRKVKWSGLHKTNYCEDINGL